MDAHDAQTANHVLPATRLVSFAMHSPQSSLVAWLHTTLRVTALR
jgi:hypothetical protein